MDVFKRGIRKPTALFSGFVDDGVELLQRVGVRVRAVVTEQVHIVFLDLDIASGLDTTVNRLSARWICRPGGIR